MGIPSFYRWLVERYPLAITDVIEEAPDSVNGVSVPVDSSRPNPNDIEFDNLYLDMNGIIHPCFHPEGVPAPETYEEVFKAVFKYIDRIFSIVRPRKLLYMAIDGVAPRAKMNQQRARRFRAAKDAADEASKTESLKGVQESEGHDLEQTKMLDSNVITPGTEFMSLLSSALRYYIHLRMNTDPGWRGIKVILSDANVPGEGEHKIMSYIRLQRNLPGFDPNTRHCLYGLDADLIMLALTTHEIHFSILREDVRRAYAKDRWSANKRQGKRRKIEQGELALKTIEDYIMSLYYQFLHVWTLRDYLLHDLSIPDPTAESDFERLIDDFVFMCIFVGNDFLPHMPSLEISEGAIDLLMVVYKKEFVHMGGYLTNSFEVNLKRVEHFIKAVSSHENAIFMKRSQVQKQEIRSRGSSNRAGVKKSQSSINHATEVGNPVIDKVKLGEEGWKDRYYAEKFEVNTNDDREKIRKQSVLKYIEGICWVMHYYYQGVCSWQWFYPYHYAPFASDFYDLDQLEIHFTLGKPFKPLDQLMGVLPAASAHALPFFYQKLMTDSSSPILDFYPLDFELDQNGKRFLWQAVCKLPFIKESRLLLEIAKVEHTLTDEEKRRNSLGLDMLFIHKSHPLSVMIFSCWKRNKDNPKLLKAKVKRKINPEVSDGMNGYIYISDEDICPLEIGPATDDMIMITKNEVVSVFYKYPSFHPHIPKPPEGVNIPEQYVRKQDVLPPPVLWHDQRSFRGRIYSERPIPNSISGSRLEKLAHQLVCKYYLAKQQGSHIVSEDLACEPNLKVAVSSKELDKGNGESQRKKKQKLVSGSKESASIGGDLASQSNIKAAVSGKVLEAGSAVELEKKKQGSQVYKGNGSHIVFEDLACEPNLKITVSSKELDAGSVVETEKKKQGSQVQKASGSHIVFKDLACEPNLKVTVSSKELDEGNGESRRKKKRKRISGSKESVSIGADLASQSNLKAAVSGKVLEAGSAVEPEKRKQGSQVYKGNGSHVVLEDLACEPNLKVTVNSKELDAGSVVEPEKKKQGSQVYKGSGSHIVFEELACEPNLKVTVGSKEEPDVGTGESRRKKKRKRVSGSKESVSIGADLASQSNLKAAVGGKVLDAGSAVEPDKKKQGSQVCKENGSHIVVDDLKSAVSGKVLDAGSAVEPDEKKQGSQVCKENGSHIVVDDLKSAVSGKVLDAGSAVEPDEKKQGSQVCKENGSHIVVDDLACEPNLKVTVGSKEEPDEGKGESPRRKRRKRYSRAKESASIGADLVSQSNLKAAVSGKVLDAGSAVEPNKKKQGSQVCKENGSQIVVDDLKEVVSGKVLGAGSAVGPEKQKQGSQVCKENGSHIVVEDLACKSDLKLTVSSKELDEGNRESRKQVSGSKESASIGVDLPSHVLDAGSVVEPGKNKRERGRDKKLRKSKAEQKLALANQAVPMEPSLI